MIPNLKHAALNHEKIVIGGGEFSRPDFLLAAHMMEHFEPLTAALTALLEMPEYDGTQATARQRLRAKNKARAALTNARNYPRSTT